LTNKCLKLPANSGVSFFRYLRRGAIREHYFAQQPVAQSTSVARVGLDTSLSEPSPSGRFLACALLWGGV